LPVVGFNFGFPVVMIPLSWSRVTAPATWLKPGRPMPLE
jgi:Sec-independent protein secretion pathway component TatC